MCQHAAPTASDGQLLSCDSNNKVLRTLRRRCTALHPCARSLCRPGTCPGPTPHLEVVHDLHFTPHIVDVLLAAAAGQACREMTLQALAWPCSSSRGNNNTRAEQQACTTCRAARQRPQIWQARSPPSRAPSRQFALGNGLAGKGLALLRLGLRQARRAKLAAPQHLAQVVITRHILRPAAGGERSGQPQQQPATGRLGAQDSTPPACESCGSVVALGTGSGRRRRRRKSAPSSR